jgi:hypothetical protein
VSATLRRDAGLASCLLLACLLAGCPGGQPAPTTTVKHEGRAVPFKDAEALLRRISEVNDGYGTLKSVHKVTAEIALGGDRTEKRSFRGVVAVQRPGFFRLQILGPMGVKFADLLYGQGRAQVLEVATSLRKSSRLPEILDSIAGDLRAIYRLDPLPHASRRTMEKTVALASGSAPLYALKETRGDEVVRQLDIFAASLAIARSVVVDVKGDVRTITYGDHRTNGKLVIPHKIHVSKEGRAFYWLSIEVESVVLDEQLDPALFVAPGQGE